MAKKKKDEAVLDEDKKSIGSKILTVLITILIIAIWLAVFALLIKFDVGGVGSKVFRPVLKNIPIVNKILPAASDEEIIEEKDSPYKSMEAALKRIDQLEEELEAYRSDASALEQAELIAELQSEVNRLKKFEKNQIDFENRVKEFEKNIVFADNAPTLEEYKEYYDSINPETAEEIYRQVVSQLQSSEVIKNMAANYAAMEAEQAAAVLEIMTGDLDLVCEILKNMKPKQSAAIIGEMDSSVAARVTKKMSLMN